MKTLLDCLFATMFIVGIIACAIMCNKTTNTTINSIKENYKKPDTTIIYKDGKWDTTIIIKNVPAWLK